MKKTTTKNARQTPNPHQLAKDAADQYFAAITARIPDDTAPGDIDLIGVACLIEEAIKQAASEKERHLIGADEDHAMQAGYLLGVEIGRRMGGAR